MECHTTVFKILSIRVHLQINCKIISYHQESIYYNNTAFNTFDDLKSVYFKENFYRNMSSEDWLKLSDRELEYRGFKYAAENKGLYPNETFNLEWQTTVNGRLAGHQNIKVLEGTSTIGDMVFPNWRLSYRYKPRYAKWYYKFPRRF